MYGKMFSAAFSQMSNGKSNKKISKNSPYIINFAFAAGKRDNCKNSTTN